MFSWLHPWWGPSCGYKNMDPPSRGHGVFSLPSASSELCYVSLPLPSPPQPLPFLCLRYLSFPGCWNQLYPTSLTTFQTGSQNHNETASCSWPNPETLTHSLQASNSGWGSWVPTCLHRSSVWCAQLLEHWQVVGAHDLSNEWIVFIIWLKGSDLPQP